MWNGLTRVKEVFSHGAQHIWELLVVRLIKGFQQFLRGTVRVFVWGIARLDVVCEGMRWGMYRLRRRYPRVMLGSRLTRRPHPYNRFWMDKSFPHLIELRVFVVIAVVAVLILWALWKIPQWQVPGPRLSDPSLFDKIRSDPNLSLKRVELEDKARGTLAQIFGGIVVLLGLCLTWRSVSVAWQNVQITREGQITERFTRAIDQLGSEKQTVCLGGIYALEQIARDSARDYWPIMEVLTAYVRENARWEGGQQLQKDKLRESEDPVSVENVQRETLQPLKLAVHIQAILTVIGRRVPQERGGTKRLGFIAQPVEKWLDLHGTDLRGADLDDAYLEGAILRDANLEGAFLRLVDLSRACLQHANLQRVDLWCANLQAADLCGASLQGARLYRVDLQAADLTGACLQFADLTGADLGGADLRDAVLRDVNFEGADLEGAKFKGADLTGARLWNVNLRGAYLEHVDLRHTALRGARFTNVHLQFANLEGTGLQGAQLEFADLQAAKLGGANLYRANLRLADLRGAYLEGANLDQANLEFTNLPGLMA